jgi:hypothetical protein
MAAAHGISTPMSAIPMCSRIFILGVPFLPELRLIAIAPGSGRFTPNKPVGAIHGRMLLHLATIQMH